MSVLLEDLLGETPPAVLAFLDHEIGILKRSAELVSGKQIEITASKSDTMRCTCKPTAQGFRINIPAEFVTRVALVSELLSRTRNPPGMRRAILSNQHNSGLDNLRLRENYEEIREKYRSELNNLPNEYKWLVGTSENELETDHLNWWLKEFIIDRFDFLHKRDFREQFRFALLFIVAHELMHVVEAHLDTRKKHRSDSAEVQTRVDRRLEIKADCGSVLSLLRFASGRAHLFCTSRGMTPDDPRFAHVYFGSAYDVARGAVLAMAFLDCNKMWSDDFSNSIYFPPASRITFALRASGVFFRKFGGGRFLEKGLFRESIGDSSWWFRTRVIFQDDKDIFDEDIMNDLGSSIATSAIIEVSNDISDFISSNLFRSTLRGSTSPFNISWGSYMTEEINEAMDACLDGEKYFSEQALDFGSFQDLPEQTNEMEIVSLRFR